MLSDKALYSELVKLGTMPAIAERIIAKRGQPMPTDAELDQLAKITPEDKDLAEAWWLYTPSVPRKFKRLLHAKIAR
jgi:hypothetical protein